MARPCSICSHSERVAIDAALAARVSLDEVVTAFGLPSRSALQRHRAAHVGRTVTLSLPPVAPSTATGPEPTASPYYNEYLQSGVAALFERAAAGPERSLQDHARLAFHEVTRLLAGAQGADDRGFALRVLRELRALLQFTALVKLDQLRMMPGWAQPVPPRDPLFDLEQLFLAQMTGVPEAEAAARAKLDEAFPGFGSALGQGFDAGTSEDASDGPE